ncbi:polysaccharide deacetylase family protein [Desulfocurvibacter africanus]|uniref:Polysaccharide deacetylase n=1 Tax=Desulfocurvibacter africanus subsp. africanus str. Walvis Bay TaxID=690850 RepID=F3YUR5_DESAF|nr:polysaccharide deacetylase family protein [Desulfocurvibacter africanus]EGJ49092.1 polysaccharide deacetylase [Desulfocurvibacter africanus subsp. africanus str. Walvis Bay]
MSPLAPTLKTTMLAGINMAMRLCGTPQGYAILYYHRLTTDWMDCRLLPSLYTHVGRMREQLLGLRRHAEVISLAELHERMSQGHEPRGLCVSVTFDDGYADNLRLGLPVLRDTGVPATLFVSTGFVDDPAIVPWWDMNFQAARAAVASMVRFRDNGFSWCFDTRSLRGRHRLLWAMNAVTLRRCMENGGRASSVAEELFPEMARPERNGFSTWDELRRASDDGLLTIGSHTVNHPVLSACADWGSVELAASKARLESELQSPVTLFAYPFGGPAHIPGDVEEQLARQGFRLAVTTTPGLNHCASDRYRLQRVSVHGNDDVGSLLAKIKSAALRDHARRLLPEAMEMFEAGRRRRTC